MRLPLSDLYKLRWLTQLDDLSHLDPTAAGKKRRSSIDHDRRLVLSRPSIPRPYYGTARPPLAGASGGSSALGSALGALGGTLGCLLCLAAIGALGLFACAIAITAYTSELRRCSTIVYTSSFAF